MLRAAFALCFVLLSLGQKTWAHTVPSMVAEAEFTPGREVTLLVNLDPRLFLTDQPTALPPVPSSWWFQQTEAEQAATLAKAAAYVDAQLQFRVGSQDLRGTWKVQAVDSATVAPLTPSSAEVHLLVKYHGRLPEVAGDFKMTVARTCAVATLLMNAMTDAEQRQPQLVFPGESSRGFALPPLGAKGAAAETPAPPAKRPAADANASGVRPGKEPATPQSRFPAHSIPAHAFFAMAVTGVLLGRFWSVALVFAVFHLAALLAAWLTWQGWLPVALGGIPRNSWVMLGGATLAFLMVRRIPPALLCMAALTGFLHAWGPWSLRVWHGVEQPLGSLFRQEGLLLLMEVAVAGVAAPGARYLVRRNILGRPFTGVES